MKAYFQLKRIGIIITILLAVLKAQATHIRAGEITAERVSPLNLLYLFTVTGYRDTGSEIKFGAGVIDFGDDTQVQGPFNTIIEPQGNGIEKVTFRIVHQYSSTNASGYVISYKEDNRNADILNMTSSVTTPFYVETVLVISESFGLNNTPVFTVPPIDFAAVGKRFIHNPGAYDPDGDSISYRFVVPRRDKGLDVTNYKELNHPDFYSDFASGSEDGDSPTLSLNPITGDLIWDAPGDAQEKGIREYNVAFVVEEWREFAGQWWRLGSVVRDMQIIVKDTENEPPDLEVPDDLCVTAGETVNERILATDPDGDQVKIEGFGGVFEVTNAATINPNGTFQNQPAQVQFVWNTRCLNVRERPYEVQFKATDSPVDSLGGVPLVDFESFNITVVGPPPTGLTGDVQGNGIDLQWSPYICSQAETMQVWRKAGTYEIMTDDCQLGMPPNTGYELIDEVDITQTTYSDEGLNAGVKYCYRLVAEFPLPGGGVSYVSQEFCDSILIVAPVITEVDVRATGENNGEIRVTWVPPYQVEQTLHPAPYTYDLLRKPTLADTDYELIATQTADTTLIDQGLNTRNVQYSYLVTCYDANNVLFDSSAVASSVKLELSPLVGAIELSWSGEVPWSLRVADYPHHYIYRNRADASDPDRLVLIDTVEVINSPLIYLDTGRYGNIPLSDSLEYCYYVSTQGSYENQLLPEPLLNNSQIACAQPNDTLPPCAPLNLRVDDAFQCENFLVDKPCTNNLYENKIIWEEDVDLECELDVIGYNIYFSLSGEEGTYEFHARTEIAEFTDTGLSSFKGCYKVSAVDRSTNESELTEAVCNDNCPQISFPSAFSPNGDGVNDVYTPIYTGQGIEVDNFDRSRCPRFVEKLEFRVVDRNGNEVFDFSSEDEERDFTIRWDGTNKLGQKLPAGVYYYHANVYFDALNPDLRKRNYKGWIQLLK